MAKIPLRSAARITSFVRAFLCKGFMEFPHLHQKRAKTDASYNKRRTMSLFRQKRKPRVFGGVRRPRVGVQQRGAGGNSKLLRAPDACRADKFFSALHT